MVRFFGGNNDIEMQKKKTRNTLKGKENQKKQQKNLTITLSSSECYYGIYLHVWCA